VLYWKESNSQRITRSLLQTSAAARARLRLPSSPLDENDRAGAKTAIADADARAVVNSVSDFAPQCGGPGEKILDELSKRHVLLVSRQDEVTYRFQHQQFQEFYAAGRTGTSPL